MTLCGQILFHSAIMSLMIPFALLIAERPITDQLQVFISLAKTNDLSTLIRAHTTKLTLPYSLVYGAVHITADAR